MSIDLTIVFISIGIIFELIFYAIIAEYIKILIGVLFTIIVSVYCNIIVSRYRDFWKLKHRVYKFLYYLKTMNFSYKEGWKIHGNIFEAGLELKVLKHKFSEERIKEIASEIYGYLDRENVDKFLNSVIVNLVKEVNPDIVLTNPNYVKINKDFLVNSLKIIKKIKPNWRVIFIGTYGL